MKIVLVTLTRSSLPALLVLATLPLLTSCGSSTTSETAKAPETGAAPTLSQSAIPSLASLGSVDITPGVELQLPTSLIGGEKYLYVVSAHVVKATPMVMPIPGMWAVGTNAPRPQPGYRINYEAELVWKPTKDVAPELAKKMLFGLPVKADSMAVFHAEDIERPTEYATVSIEPNKPFKVPGTLYVSLQYDAAKKPLLVVYPYVHRNTSTAQALTRHYLPIK